MIDSDYTIFPEERPKDEYRPPVNPANLAAQMQQLLAHEGRFGGGRISTYDASGEEIAKKAVDRKGRA